MSTQAHTTTAPSATASAQENFTHPRIDAFTGIIDWASVSEDEREEINAEIADRFFSLRPDSDFPSWAGIGNGQTDKIDNLVAEAVEVADRRAASAPLTPEEPTPYGTTSTGEELVERITEAALAADWVADFEMPPRAASKKHQAGPPAIEAFSQSLK